MKNFTLITILCIMLSGCASMQPSTEKVYIPVAKKCYDGNIPEEPILITDSITKDTDIDIALKSAFVDIKQLKIYSRKLNNMICKD